ncbi:hypothetical protein [Pseudomonas cavernae]|uniref:hypothetical protein n=1 Tax=Pseudomonas cavernae TaxID=2320867 RepID=UPI0013C539F0|nr:hypothetical protein [Pseudomonas cavernae]
MNVMNLWPNIVSHTASGLAFSLLRAWRYEPAGAERYKHARLIDNAACCRLASSCVLCELALQRMFCCMQLVLFALLSGCAMDDAHLVLIRDDVLIHVRLVEHIDYKPGAEAYGLTRCANGVCVLEILRDRYPFCLQHELRHAFEGDWHGQQETLEDC